MAVMLLESSDPQFSFHLKKNPASGLTAKSMRQGSIMGWYPNGDQQKYAMYFKNNSHSAAFSNEGKDYLDVTQYASTYFVFHGINTLLSGLLSPSNVQDLHSHTLTVPCVQLRNGSVLEYLNKFIGLEIESTLISENEDSMGLYRVTLSQKGVTLNDFAMRAYLMFYLLHADLHQGDLAYMEGMIAKVAAIMKHLKSEYFLWYWFSKNVIVKEGTFSRIQRELGANSIDGSIAMQYGPTQQQRKNYTDKHIDFKRNILDVGCGEGYYLLPYLKKLPKEGHIIGVEPVDKLRTGIFDKAVDRKKEENVTLVSSIDEVDFTDTRDIICIEVIEHMPLEDAKTLVDKMLKMNFNKLVISTPNRSFNKFYKTLEGFRHDDHHFEMDETEFRDFIVERMKLNQLGAVSAKFEKVGDIVDGISMAQAVVITKG